MQWGGTRVHLVVLHDFDKMGSENGDTHLLCTSRRTKRPEQPMSPQDDNKVNAPTMRKRETHPPVHWSSHVPYLFLPKTLCDHDALLRTSECMEVHVPRGPR